MLAQDSWHSESCKSSLMALHLASQKKLRIWQLTPHPKVLTTYGNDMQCIEYSTIILQWSLHPKLSNKYWLWCMLPCLWRLSCYIYLRTIF